MAEGAIKKTSDQSLLSDLHTVSASLSGIFTKTASKLHFFHKYAPFRKIFMVVMYHEGTYTSHAHFEGQ